MLSFCAFSSLCGLPRCFRRRFPAAVLLLDLVNVIVDRVFRQLQMRRDSIHRIADEKGALRFELRDDGDLLVSRQLAHVLSGHCNSGLNQRVEHFIHGLLEVLRPYGVLEMVRTGIVAMRRGNKPSNALSSPEEAEQAMTDDDLSQSV